MTAPQTQAVSPPRHTTDPQTGRRITQITTGDAYCCPIYFYGPTATADSRFVLFHRFENDQVQLWKTEIQTGHSTQLTFANTQDCLWRKWDEPTPSRGVRALQNAFCPETNELFYFDENVLHAVHVDTLADRGVFELPAGRVICGIPGVSPDGKHFLLMHVDCEWWNGITADKRPDRTDAKGVKLDVIEVETGKSRTLLTVDFWITHADFIDNHNIVFSHPPTELGAMVTDLRGKWYAVVRPQTEAGWQINHCSPTPRGLMYETVSPGDFGVVGLCNPHTYAYQDYRTNHPVHHIGHDPEGKLFFGDYYRMDSLYERVIGWFPTLNPGRLNEFVPLTRGMKLHGNPKWQRSHVHASVMPDRQNILFTGPDDQTQTNHLFLLDIADLSEAETLAEDAPFVSAADTVKGKR